MAPCHSALNTPPKKPAPPSVTASTKTIAAVARPGAAANRHGFCRAQRSARPPAPLRAAPTAATVKNATAPADSEPVTARCRVSRCRPRSAAVTTAPAAPATPHGACDSTAPETDISSRRDSPGSLLRVGAVIIAPWIVVAQNLRYISSCAKASHISTDFRGREARPVRRSGPHRVVTVNLQTALPGRGQRLPRSPGNQRSSGRRASDSGGHDRQSSAGLQPASRLVRLTGDDGQAHGDPPGRERPAVHRDNFPGTG